MKRYLVAAVVCLLYIASPAFAQSSGDQSSPESALKKWNKAVLHRKHDEAVSCILPDELEKFRAWYIWDFDRSDIPWDPEQNPYDTAAKATKVTGATLLAKVYEIEAYFGDMEYAEQMGRKPPLRDSTISILGVVEESPDRVHIVEQFLSFKKAEPQPYSLTKHEGKWYLDVPGLYDPAITMWEGLKSEPKGTLVDANPSTPYKVNRVKVLGSVKHNADAVAVVAKLEATYGGYKFEFVRVCNLEPSDPAWKLLGNEDRKELNDALRTEFERQGDPF